VELLMWVEAFAHCGTLLVMTGFGVARFGTRTGMVWRAFQSSSGVFQAAISSLIAHASSTRFSMASQTQGGGA